MMDLAMAATLLICFGVMKLFVDWCDKQIRPQEEKEQ
jgi:hypothetical protein